MKNKDIFQRLLITSIIVLLCTATVYFLWWGDLDFRKYESLRIVATIIAVTFFALYMKLTEKIRESGLVGFSITFEVIGYWWLKNWIGYVFIILGFVLIVMSFFSKFKTEEN